MKRNFLTCSVLTIAFILVPLMTMRESEDVTVTNSPDVTIPENIISVMKSENGKVLSLNKREYLIGVLAAEADTSFHEEALKAQVISAHTFALYTKNKTNDSDFNGADLTDDPQVHQGYLSVDERKKKWGNDFEKNEKMFGEIVDSVGSKTIYYNGEPVLAVYHELNNGKTQSAENVWNQDIPYLLQTESPGDKLSTKLNETKKFTFEEFERLISQIDGVKIHGDNKNWVGNIEKNEDGYIKSVNVCGNKVSSQDFRTALGLKSCAFTVKRNDEGFLITTSGNGHMVGMSQYGADYMARQGMNYKEILKYYYSDVEIR